MNYNIISFNYFTPFRLPTKRTVFDSVGNISANKNKRNINQKNKIIEKNKQNLAFLFCLAQLSLIKIRRVTNKVIYITYKAKNFHLISTSVKLKLARSDLQIRL